MSKLHQSIRSAVVNACLNAGVDSANTIKREVATACNGISRMSIAGIKAHMTRNGIACKAVKGSKATRKEPKGTRLC